jgi:hypothetical protein
MKTMKVLGIATVAAMAMAVLLGSGSASATVLCKQAPTPEGSCPSSSTLPAGTEVTMRASNLTFTGFPFYGDLVCGREEEGGSWLSFKTTQASADPLPAEVRNLSFRRCDHTGGLGCTLTEAKGGTFSLHSEGFKGSGSVSLSNGPRVNMNCGTYAICEYQFSFGPAPFTGGNPGKFTLKEAPISRVAALYGSCPETLKVSGVYRVVVAPTIGGTTLWLGNN